MARIPFPEDVDPDLVESQRPDSLPEKYSHIGQQDARNVYRSIAHDPEVVETLRAHIGATWEHCGLSDRDRELVLLSVAREIDSAYEWHQHVRIAILEGISPEEIRALSARDYESFDDTETLLMEFAAAAASNGVTDEDVESLREAFPDDDVAGIVALVGVYVDLNVILSAFDVETEEPFVGWELENLERD
jgi:alkylhydroperoxidase family enzyme